METILDILAQAPGLWAFVLLLLCGLGMPPWSEEVVILGAGYFVAQDAIGFLPACAWCFAGILAGDTIIFSMGRLGGERVYSWPILRRSFRPARRKRFNAFFLKYGTRAVFFARFVPGVRMWTYLVAGNLRMPLWKFLALDFIGALLTVPVSVYLGALFAENLDRLRHLIHVYQTPIIALLVLGAVWFFLRLRKRRSRRLESLRAQRAARDLGQEQEGDGFGSNGEEEDAV